jgi:hypothetical protein
VIGRIDWLTTKTQLIVADESDVPTKEGLVVELDVSILHSIEPAKAADLFITVGPLSWLCRKKEFAFLIDCLVGGKSNDLLL